jgi:glycosyltransferase involved in cell wall biosynthesis
MLSEPLVTVVIPAYNASATIDETLASVRAQTHRNLEIVVVDDGSRDATTDLVLNQAKVDPRIRLIRQANAGVAAARNRGIAEASAELIAPVDADDLWRPDKIARQVSALDEGGARVALVYTWFASIDAASSVLGLSYPITYQGEVLPEILRSNFIGNGSACLMRKAAVVEVGAYDPSLRARAGQGCEDWKLYMLLAEKYEFAVVRDYLIGYRRLPENMSSDIMQMLRSWELIAAVMRTRQPGLLKQIEAGGNDHLLGLILRAQEARRNADVARLTAMLLRRNLRAGLNAIRTATLPWLLRAFRKRVFRAAEAPVSNSRVPFLA